MKKTLKLTALITALGLALVFTACKNPASDDNSEKESKPAVETPDETDSDDEEKGGSSGGEITPKPVKDELHTPLTLEAVEDGELLITNPWSTLRYIKNGEEAVKVIATDPDTNNHGMHAKVEASAGDIFEFYADGSENDTAAYPLSFSFYNGRCCAYGNVMSLQDSENFATLKEITTEKAFQELFGYNPGGIINHDEKNILLPATTLTKECYYAMFYGSNITKAPALPATTLAEACYENMFSVCHILEQGPELPAPVLVKDCYKYMFYYSPKINYVKCLATDISAKECTHYWLDYVSDTGTFVKAVETDWSRDGNGIPESWAIAGTGKISIKDNMTNGTLTSNDSYVYYGETVTLSIHPEEGYVMDFVTISDSNNNFITPQITKYGEGGIITFTMPQSDVYVSASFKIGTFKIYSEGPGSVRIKNAGSGTPSERFNSKVTIEYYPSWGYMLDTISVKKVNGEEVEITGDEINTRPVVREFIMPGSDVTITVTQKLRDNTIDISGITNLTVSGPQTAQMGEDVTLTFAPKNGYDLDTVTVKNTTGTNPKTLDINRDGNSISFKMDWDDVTVNATYKAEEKNKLEANGDLVLSSGKYISYENLGKMTAAQKENVVAIITDAAQKRGIGLEVVLGIKWCTSEASAFESYTISISETDGRLNTQDEIAKLSDYSKEKYPAFWYATSYSVPGFESGWYLPAKVELQTIFSEENSIKIQAIFTALGKELPYYTVDWYWTSTNTGTDGMKHFAWNGTTSIHKETGGNIIVLRIFN